MKDTSPNTDKADLGAFALDLGPSDNPEIVAKFTEFAALILSEARTGVIRDAVMGLDETGRPFAPLTRHLSEAA